MEAFLLFFLHFLLEILFLAIRLSQKRYAASLKDETAYILRKHANVKKINGSGFFLPL